MRMILTALAFTALATGAPAASPQPKLYAVIFEVSHNVRGQLTQFDMARVIDPKADSTKALDVHVPQSFLDGARGRALEPLAAGKPDHFFTYYLLNPERPTDLYIDKY